ncbi:hypothetical protein ERJ75_001411100 [Trypanosoma vivax]|uniref:Uncharacterized protein n=1 Tax=Trypanosoma vivax (strain Y486) TaxID=1055687 RepID=G0TUA2_TRYVY|nr:hypothetical protein TRVL_01050 [Trypanosoma vivax]KAH8607460.1 hypothetical protein ERJ75_001411100 [Trypanosoma vivax]CCC47536.1 conserved hypothetical protein [Trypanosoma vivax Y486]
MSEALVTPGSAYRILACSTFLRRHLTDSYWCSAMDKVCEGKLVGVAVRYTGQRLVFLQFRPKELSTAGYRYPLSMSIPIEYLVPCQSKEDNPGLTADGIVSSQASDEIYTGKQRFAPLCVVCGRYGMPDMVPRRHGYKCKECVGKKSSRRLRLEMRRLWS